ncbi:MAG TPA: phosphotransferase [Rhizomicrobium sp.]|nr:phosphotransferase [Rhizomicrobium sp.]
MSALRAVFGAKSIGAMRPISGGVSGAPILRFEVGGRAYVLRLEPERIALHHRERHFACMASAAAAGAAPAVHYTDAATGVAIMDCIAGQPLTDYPGGPAALVRGLGALIARVQTSAPFPVAGDFPQSIETMLTALNASGLFVPNALDRHAEGLARIRSALPWDTPALVSSHNDPNPRNILFDGNRLWLIDWELACRNDPLVDIAILTFDLAETTELEDTLLAAALGRPADRALRARLAVIKLLTRLFYGCIVLENFMHSPRDAPDEKLDEYRQSSFRAAIASGQLAAGSQDVAYAFGKMSLTEFANGITASGFDTLLQIVKQS